MKCKTIYKKYYILCNIVCALFGAFDVLNQFLCYTTDFVRVWYQICLCLSLIQLGVGLYAYSRNTSMLMVEKQYASERFVLCWKQVFVCLLFLRLGMGLILSQTGRHIGLSALGTELEREIQGKGFVTAICCFSAIIHEYRYERQRYGR